MIGSHYGLGSIGLGSIGLGSIGLTGNACLRSARAGLSQLVSLVK